MLAIDKEPNQWASDALPRRLGPALLAIRLKRPATPDAAPIPVYVKVPGVETISHAGKSILAHIEKLDQGAVILDKDTTAFMPPQKHYNEIVPS